MLPIVVAAVVGYANPAPPPPYFLSGYYPRSTHAAYQMTVPGPVVQPNTAMFRIERNPG